MASPTSPCNSAPFVFVDLPDLEDNQNSSPNENASRPNPEPEKATEDVKTVSGEEVKNEEDEEFNELINERRKRREKALKILGSSKEEFERKKALSVLGLTESNLEQGKRLFASSQYARRSSLSAPPARDREHTRKAIRTLGLDEVQISRLKAVALLGVPDYEIDEAFSKALASIGSQRRRNSLGQHHYRSHNSLNCTRSHSSLQS